MSARELLELHDYSVEEQQKLLVINVICSTLSCFGACFILFNYFMFDEFRKNFAFRLIFCVAIGDLITSIGNFFGNPENDTPLCTVQGIFAELGALTSICWVTAISCSIWYIIQREKPPTNEDSTRLLKKLHAIIWTYILICTILPATTNSYGTAGGWCWIKGKSKVDNVWRFVLFYIPLWICVCFITFVYCRVWSRLGVTVRNQQHQEQLIGNVDEEESVHVVHDNDGDGDNEEMKPTMAKPTGEMRRSVVSSSKSSRGTQSKSSTLQRMKWYPMVLALCYTPATIRRLYELVSNDTESSPLWMAALQVFFSALIGLFNAIVYVASQKAVRDKDVAWFKQHCGCVRGGRDSISLEYPKQQKDDMNVSIQQRI